MNGAWSLCCHLLMLKDLVVEIRDVLWRWMRTSRSSIFSEARRVDRSGYPVVEVYSSWAQVFATELFISTLEPYNTGGLIEAALKSFIDRKVYQGSMNFHVLHHSKPLSDIPCELNRASSTAIQIEPCCQARDTNAEGALFH